MVHWNLQDNQGCLHHIAMHDAVWVSDLPPALLSPHNVSQQANDHFPHPHGKCMQQLSNKCKPSWQHWQFVKTIPLDPHFFIHLQAWKKLALWQKIQSKYKHQSIIEHLTFASIVLDSEGENNDSPPFSKLHSPTINDQFPFTCGSDAN